MFAFSSGQSWQDWKWLTGIPLHVVWSSLTCGKPLLKCKKLLAGFMLIPFGGTDTVPKNIFSASSVIFLATHLSSIQNEKYLRKAKIKPTQQKSYFESWILDFYQNKIFFFGSFCPLFAWKSRLFYHSHRIVLTLQLFVSLCTYWSRPGFEIHRLV